MLDDNGEWLDATLTDIMYVPGLSRHLFSIMKFASYGHYAVVCGNATSLYFGNNSSPMTLMAHSGGNTLAADLQLHKNYEEYHTIPSSCNRDHSQNKKRLSLELLYMRLGHHKCHTLLATSKHNHGMILPFACPQRQDVLTAA